MSATTNREELNLRLSTRIEYIKEQDEIDTMGHYLCHRYDKVVNEVVSMDELEDLVKLVDIYVDLPGERVNTIDLPF